MADVTQENIERIEKETLALVDKTLTSLEAAEKARGEGKGAFEAYHALRSWRDGFLAREMDETLGERIERLRELKDICRAYG